MARTSQETLKERALELGVYLPLGAYARVRDGIADLNAPRARKVLDDLGFGVPEDADCCADCQGKRCSHHRCGDTSVYV